MKRSTFFVLVMLVLWVWMIIRTFFWWTWKKNTNIEILQQSKSWFIEELTSSWSDIPSLPKSNTNWIKEYTEIKVMMPKYFYNSWWKKFAENLYSWQKIFMNFIFIDNLNRYRDILSDPTFTGADLFLYPFDRKDSISTRPFNFQQDIQSEFDSFISPIITNTNTTFLPFAADPMIMYTLPWYNIQSNFSEILNLTYDRNKHKKKPMSFPVFFWLSREDYNNEWFIREYKDITRYSLIHYFTTYRDEISLKNRMENNIFDYYNITDLNAILKAIATPECKHFPSICFQLYKFVWIRFWFLSDNDIINSYFSSKKSEFNIIIKQELPFSQMETPVRIRWRSIPNSLNNTNTINAIYKFFEYYMNSHKKYNLRNSTLSVFNNKNDEEKSLINTPFIWIRWYILQTWWNYLKKLKNINIFRQLLNYEISAWEYLNKT